MNWDEPLTEEDYLRLREGWWPLSTRAGKSGLFELQIPAGNFSYNVIHLNMDASGFDYGRVEILVLVVRDN